MIDEKIKYPDITVQLSNENGNAFVIVSRVQRALKENNVPNQEIQKFIEEVTSGDYDNLVRTCCKWVNVE